MDLLNALAQAAVNDVIGMSIDMLQDGGPIAVEGIGNLTNAEKMCEQACGMLQAELYEQFTVENDPSTSLLSEQLVNAMVAQVKPAIYDMCCEREQEQIAKIVAALQATPAKATVWDVRKGN